MMPSVTMPLTIEQSMYYLRLFTHMGNTMDDAIDPQIRQILYTNPKVDLSPADIDALNTLPIDAVREVIRTIYVTETNRAVIGKTYDAILALQRLETVAFFIDVCDEKPSDGRTTCCQTLGDFLIHARLPSSVKYL
jgi:hypothetical protein